MNLSVTKVMLFFLVVSSSLIFPAMSGDNVPDTSFISSSGVTNQVLQMIGAQQEQGFASGSPVEHFLPGRKLNKRTDRLDEKGNLCVLRTGIFLFPTF